MKKLLVMMVIGAIAVLSAYAGPQGEGAAPTEPVVIKILKGNRNFDPSIHPVKAAIEEVTGYQTEWHMLPQAPQQANERVMLELSAGTDFDWIATNKTVYYDVAGKGALLALDDLLKEHGQNILDGATEMHWQEMTVGGKIYALPVKRSPENTYNSVGYRADVFEQLGLADPETLEDFTKALRTIKGETDLIPFTCSSEEIGDVRPVAAAFGLSNYWKEIDGTLLPRPLQPAMKEYLQYWIELREQGLIDPEIPSNKRENEQEKIASGRAAMNSAGWGEWQTYVAMKDQVPGSEIAIMKALQGPDGTREMALGGVLADWPNIMPRSAKQPVEAMKFANAFADKEGFARLVGGELGVHYEDVDGDLRPINPAFNDEVRMIWWYLISTRRDVYPKYFELGPKSNHPIVFWMYNELQSNRQYAVADPTTLVLPRPALEGKYRNSLIQLSRDFYIRVIFGSESIDNYDKFLELWLSEGGQEMMDEMQREYAKIK